MLRSILSVNKCLTTAFKLRNFHPVPIHVNISNFQDYHRSYSSVKMEDYSVGSVTTNFVQLLPVIMPCTDYPNGKILLCKWKTGNYADRYTGLIKSVDNIFEKRASTSFDSELKELLIKESRSLVPEATDKYVDKIELKGVLRFDGPPDCDEYIYLATYKTSIAVHEFPLLKFDINPCSWFDWDKIPFDNMPADDAIWYPKVLSQAKKIRGHFNFGGLEERTIKYFKLFEVENF